MWWQSHRRECSSPLILHSPGLVDTCCVCARPVSLPSAHLNQASLPYSAFLQDNSTGSILSWPSASSICEKSIRLALRWRTLTPSPLAALCSILSHNSRLECVCFLRDQSGKLGGVQWRQIATSTPVSAICLRLENYSIHHRSTQMPFLW